MALRPLLRQHGARAAYLIGSRARGGADEHSDIDVIIVAESDRAEVDRFRDYLPAIVASPVGVDLFVYTPEEFERLRERFPQLSTLRETAGLLDQYYIATRYPNGLAGGVPFEAFGERQAREAIEGAGQFVAIAREQLPVR